VAQLLTDQLRLMAAEFGDEVGYEDVGSGAALTFAEWDARSNRLGRWLVDEGVGRGQRVALYLPPEEGLDWIVAYAAIHKAGAVAVPTSTRLVVRELEFVLDHAGAVAAIAGAAVTQNLVDARPALPALRSVVTTGVAADGMVAWADTQRVGAEALQVALTGDDLADIMYTSGTTGRPKGVAVHHRNVAMVPNGKPVWTGDGWLHASPLWTFAGIASVYNPMKLGMRGLYLPRFDAARWLDVVEQRQPRAVFLVPAMAQLLIASPRFETADLSSIGMLSLGSSPVAPETLRRLHQRLPQAMVANSWGMTEAGPAFCSMPPGEAERRVGSVGKPMPPTEFRIVDADGATLPAGEIGELAVRNDGRERQYLRDAEATAATWRDGWLYSGDLARLDEDGFLYIVGRKKDVIIRGGNNVHATDVEAVLYEHPSVQEAAVAGVAHPVLGEDVAAWVVLRPGEVTTLDELRAFAAERLSDYKVPRRITLVGELPRNATGKVLKQDLVALGSADDPDPSTPRR
jgi:acyl-CoA synthetase (AMP-forming)/AMP-acid ligase II